MKENEMDGGTQAAGLTRNEARERVLAFLEQWPKGHQHPDDLYIQWAGGKEYVLRKSEILAAMGEA